MTQSTNEPRIDTTSRLIDASPGTIWAAFASAEAWAQWLPPVGMTASIASFDFRQGGRYNLTLTYGEGGHGKSTDLTDVIQGTFATLVPETRMVQLVEFESDEHAFNGTMRMTWELSPERDATRITIRAEDVPSGISAKDHRAGLQSTLEKLARYVAQPLG